MSDFLRENLGYRLLALFCSILLWGYVHIQQGPPTRTLQDAIDFRNLNSGLVLTSGVRTVNIEITGPEEILERLTPGDFETYVDLQGCQQGTYELPVQCQALVQPDLLRFTVSPSTIRVQLEELITRTMPIKPRLSGPPPPGYHFGAVLVTPRVAKVTGVRHLVEQIVRLEATALAENSEVNQVTPVLPVNARGDVVTGVKVEPGEARIYAGLEKEITTRLVLVNPILTGRPSAAVKIEGVSAEPRYITARGDFSTLSGVDVVHTIPISVKSLTDSVTVTVPLERIPGVQLTPNQVKVTIWVSPLPSGTLEETPSRPKPPREEPSRSPVPDEEAKSKR